MKRREFMAAMVGAVVAGPVAMEPPPFRYSNHTIFEMRKILRRMIEGEARAKIRAIQEEEFRLVIEGEGTGLPVGLLRAGTED